MPVSLVLRGLLEAGNTAHPILTAPRTEVRAKEFGGVGSGLITRGDLRDLSLQDTEFLLHGKTYGQTHETWREVTKARIRSEGGRDLWIWLRR